MFTIPGRFEYFDCMWASHTTRPAVSARYLHVYIWTPLQHRHMADEDSSRTARPKGGPNATQLSRAQKRYKVFDKEANTEYKRLLAINAGKQLNPNANPAEHAVFYHLCKLREGWLHLFCEFMRVYRIIGISADINFGNIMLTVAPPFHRADHLLAQAKAEAAEKEKRKSTDHNLTLHSIFWFENELCHCCAHFVSDSCDLTKTSF